jgi:hypothetical protein
LLRLFGLNRLLCGQNGFLCKFGSFCVLALVLALSRC